MEKIKIFATSFTQVAQIHKNGKTMQLGRFKTEEEARNEYLKNI